MVDFTAARTMRIFRGWILASVCPNEYSIGRHCKWENTVKAKISGDPAVAAAVLEAEEQRLSAMRANDSTALAPFLADNLVYVFSSAIAEDKAGYLMAISHGTMKYENDLHIRDVEVRAFSDCAIVMGVLECHLALYGGRHHSVNRFTMLWVRDGSRWQMSTWQSTPVPAEAP